VVGVGGVVWAAALLVRETRIAVGTLRERVAAQQARYTGPARTANREPLGATGTSSGVWPGRDTLPPGSGRVTLVSASCHLVGAVPARRAAARPPPSPPIGSVKTSLARLLLAAAVPLAACGDGQSTAPRDPPRRLRAALRIEGPTTVVGGFDGNTFACQYPIRAVATGDHRAVALWGALRAHISLLGEPYAFDDTLPEEAVHDLFGADRIRPGQVQQGPSAPASASTRRRRRTPSSGRIALPGTSST